MTKGALKRDAEATKERILSIGIREFCNDGYSGSRIDAIAKKSKCNIRMIYHYFGNKEGLYLAALERVYSGIRQHETELEFSKLEPALAIQTLVEFTFDHHVQNKEFIDLVVVENVQRGRYLKKVANISKESNLLIETIDRVLQDGTANGVFREDTDAFQLYISILSLCFFHLSNHHTLSITHDRNLKNKEWINDRRKHVVEIILGYLRPA